jgi:hypothetical protein
MLDLCEDKKVLDHQGQGISLDLVAREASDLYE